jgi:hypothetical protein
MAQATIDSVTTARNIRKRLNIGLLVFAVIAFLISLSQPLERLVLLSKAQVTCRP